MMDLNPATDPGGPRPGWIVAALAVLALLLHLPRLNAPFAEGEINAGLFFGIASKNYAAIGFEELRGAPLGWQLWRPTDLAIPYLHHPPGLFWWMASLGTAEWAHRIPTMLCAWAAAALLFVLLRPRLGTWPAALGGVTLLGVPSFTLYSQASYETVVVAFGLLLWWSHARYVAAPRGARLGWAVAVAATAFVGPWMDWSFGLFGLGLLFLCARRSVGATVSRLLIPAVASLLAVAVIVAWKHWAAAGPHLRQDLPQATIGKMLELNILTRPSWSAWWDGARQLIPATASAPVAIAAIAGVFALFARAPRPGAALLFVGVAHFALFATHAVNHPHFYCFFTVPLAASCGAIATLGRAGGRLRAVALGAAGLIALGAWAIGIRTTQRDTTDYYRDLGRYLTEVAGADRGTPYPGRVFHNAPRVYPYYVDSPEVMVPAMISLPVLRAICEAPARNYELHFLWFEVASGPTTKALLESSDPGIGEFLAKYPRRRVPQLEGVVEHGLWGTHDRFDEIYLVTIPPPPR